MLELPVTAALSSAEGFAANGVQILSGVCSRLCFGAETADKDALWAVASALLEPAFSSVLKEALSKGVSFPAARQQALEQLDANANIVTQPNNILAVEYCKAILSQGSAMEIMPVLRQGDYHDALPDNENPSATAVRGLVLSNKDWQSYVPETAKALFACANRHCLQFGEQAILAKLRTMTDEEFEALPYSSEGLWRKLMHASRSYATLEEILAAVKSKRYTRSRLDRMVLCAFLGITKDIITAPAPYVRALAFNDAGRDILKQFRNKGDFPNIGQNMDNPYQQVENRCADLYGLFAEVPEPPGSESKYRVYYHKNGEA